MSDTVRRAIAAFATFCTPFVAAFLTSKGFAVSDQQVTAAEVGLMLYIGQSVVNTMHARSTASAAAKPAVVVAPVVAAAPAAP